jgi:hypothetical protein
VRHVIEQRFHRNIARVRNLLTIYQTAGGNGAGRRPVHSADVLRAATVLLHASLEDAMRSIAEWKLPSAEESILNEVPLAGSVNVRPEKFFLGKLSAHRAKTVQQLIDESVQAYLNTFTVSSIDEIAGFCTKVGVRVDEINAQFPELSEMIKRRHHIVHKADTNENAGQGNHQARSLSSATVERWVTTVRIFTLNFLQHVPD